MDLHLEGPGLARDLLQQPRLQLHLHNQVRSGAGWCCLVLRRNWHLGVLLQQGARRQGQVLESHSWLQLEGLDGDGSVVDDGGGGGLGTGGGGAPGEALEEAGGGEGAGGVEELHHVRLAGDEGDT